MSTATSLRPPATTARRARRAASLLSVLVVLAAAPGALVAAGLDYEELGAGVLSGKLLVQWLEPDLFLFIPHEDSPLTFERASGEAIVPRRMLTDGGSIPRPVWILRNYSPWGFAPAFIVHDWLFVMKQCGIAGNERFTLEEAGLVMAEVMKTMIESGKVDAGPLTVQSMYLAVISPPARESWETGGCNEPPLGAYTGELITQFELDFD